MIGLRYYLNFLAYLLFAFAFRGRAHADVQVPVSPPTPGEPVFPIAIEETFKNNDKFMGELFNMLATLGLLLAFVILIAWVFKKMMNVKFEQADKGSSINILEKRTLSTRSILYLVEIEGKTLLIGESQNGVTHICQIDNPVSK